MSDEQALSYETPLLVERPFWHRFLPSRQKIPIFATIGVFIVLYVLGIANYRNFGSYNVFVNLLQNNATLGLAAVGMTFVILSGGIDLSVGAIVSLVSITTASLIMKAEFNPLLVFAIVLIGGTLFGLMQGALIAFFALPPFLVTLAGLFLGSGLALLVSRESISIKHDLYTAVADFSWNYFPVTAILFLSMLAIGWWLAHQTRFGRAVYAIGGNEQSALFMGVAVKRTKVLTYGFSGFCAALGGIVMTFFLSSGNSTSGNLLELDAIAAVVIGGTLLTGGVGYILGTLIGVLILGLIQTIISFDGRFDSFTTKLFIGGLLLAFILLQKVVQGRAGKA